MAAILQNVGNTNSPINKLIWTKLRWSHPIMSPTCLPWCVCHGNRCCLLMAHWTFSSYRRLEAESVNRFWWNLVHNSKLGPQWQPRDQILKFLKFKMANGRHVGKYWKCNNSSTNGLIRTNLGRSHPSMFPTCLLWCGCHGLCCHGNARCIEHSAVMSVWRRNAWTNFDDIWYTRTN